MTNAEMKEKVLQAIKAMNADVLCYTYNEFCNETGIGNGAYSMDEVDEIFCHYPPSKIMEIVKSSSEFNPYDEYFYEDAPGELVSLSELNVDDKPIADLIDEMVDFVVEEKNSLDSSVLERILNEEE